MKWGRMIAKWVWDETTKLGSACINYVKKEAGAMELVTLFCTVDHVLMLDRLHHTYGLRAWFAGAWLVQNSYMPGRTQSVGQLQRSDVHVLSGDNSIRRAAGFGPRTKLVRPVRRQGHRNYHDALFLGSRSNARTARTNRRQATSYLS